MTATPTNEGDQPKDGAPPPAPTGAEALFADGAPPKDDGKAEGEAGAPWWKAQDFGISADKPDADTLSDAEWLERKGFKGLPDFIKSARNLESKIGADGKVVLPKGADDKDGWAELAKALGRPDTPEGYELKLAEGYDEKFVGTFRQKAHDIGLAPHQAQELVDWFEGTTAAEEKVNADKARDELQELWKGDYAANIQHSQRALAKLGLTPGDVNEMAVGYGLSNTMALFAKIGQGLAEDNGLPGAGGGNFQDGEQWAATRKQEILSSRELQAKLQAGDPQLLADWNRIAEIESAALERKRAQG